MIHFALTLPLQVIIALSAVRLGSTAAPPRVYWLMAVDALLCLSDFAWQRAGRGSHARWREALPLLIGLNHVVLGAGQAAVAWAEGCQAAPAASGTGTGWLAAAQHGVLFLLMSQALNGMMQCFFRARIM